MKYISTIMPHSRFYTIGIRDGEFLLCNLVNREDYTWPTQAIDKKSIDGYRNIAGNTKARLILIEDPTTDTVRIAIETRLSLALIIADWREVLQFLRRNLVDLSDGDYLIGNLSTNYRFSIGNMYLYPELNVFDRVIKIHAQTPSIDELIDNATTIIPWKEAVDFLPLGKIGRFKSGLLITCGELWWFDAKAHQVYLFSNQLFENVPEFSRDSYSNYQNGGMIDLPRFLNGSTWHSPLLTVEDVNGLINVDNLDTMEIIPAAGTRISTITANSKHQSGKYFIPGYGDFARVPLSNKVIVTLRNRCNGALGLYITSNRFVALFSLSDMGWLYIRDNPQWKEPLIKQPMVDGIQLDPAEPPVESGDGDLDDVVDELTDPGNDGEESDATPMTRYEERHLELQATFANLDAAVAEAPVEVADTPEEDKVRTIVVDLSPEEIRQKQQEFSDMQLTVGPEPTVKSEPEHSPWLKMPQNKAMFISPLNKYQPTITPMWYGDIYLIDLPAPYNNTVPWTRVNPAEYGHLNNQPKNCIISFGQESFLLWGHLVYRTAMHLPAMHL